VSSEGVAAEREKVLCFDARGVTRSLRDGDAVAG
jgi:hypothetical protein